MSSPPSHADALMSLMTSFKQMCCTPTFSSASLPPFSRLCDDSSHGRVPFLVFTHTHAHTDTLLTLGPLRAVRASRSNSQPHTHTPASGIFRARESVCGRVWRKLSLTGHDRNTLSLRAHPSAPATCRVTEMCHIRTQTQARRCFSLVAPCSAC